MFLKSFKVSWPAACQLMPTDSEYIDERVLYSSQSVDQLETERVDYRSILKTRIQDHSLPLIS